MWWLAPVSWWYPFFKQTAMHISQSPTYAHFLCPPSKQMHQTNRQHDSTEFFHASSENESRRIFRYYAFWMPSHASIDLIKGLKQDSSNTGTLCLHFLWLCAVAKVWSVLLLLTYRLPTTDLSKTNKPSCITYLMM